MTKRVAFAAVAAAAFEAEDRPEGDADGDFLTLAGEVSRLRHNPLYFSRIT